MKWENCFVERSRRSLASEPTTIPLASWADRELQHLAEATGAPEVAALRGATLLGERAQLARLAIPDRASAGGGCRFYAARSGWVALNLARTDDRDLLPALFETTPFDTDDEALVANLMSRCDPLGIVARGREMGLAIAALDEPPPEQTAFANITTNSHTETPAQPPMVVDLSALWAGPLASHLLGLSGAKVVKVESRRRPDAMRHGEPAFFDLLNQGKGSVVLDFTAPSDRQALLALLRRADIVIEASRPRALLQLGVDADELVRQRPGLVWMTICAHGPGERAHWVGFGDDCGVAAGLSRELLNATGEIGFVGDAIADPLTGIAAARLAWDSWRSGRGARMFVSMRGVVAEAIRREREGAPAAFAQDLVQWAAKRGAPFPPVRMRRSAPARPFGADTAKWIGAPC